MMELVLHVMDIVENSTRAGADVVAISFVIDTGNDTLSIDILDNGSGMDGDLVSMALDPFGTTKTGKRTGLGLPLLREAAERTGGALHVTSTPSEGTQVSIIFGLAHVDRQPVGDLIETMAVMLVSHPNSEFVLQVEKDGEAFIWQSPEIAERFGENVRRTDMGVLKWVREQLKPLKALLPVMGV
ncbi:ATP-binding protein [bacterium]|nr:ATP-binding protein [bacterium]